jgi:hypothetical protein
MTKANISDHSFSLNVLLTYNNSCLTEYPYHSSLDDEVHITNQGGLQNDIRLSLLYVEYDMSQSPVVHCPGLMQTKFEQ